MPVPHTHLHASRFLPPSCSIVPGCRKCSKALLTPEQSTVKYNSPYFMCPSYAPKAAVQGCINMVSAACIGLMRAGITSASIADARAAQAKANAERAKAVGGVVSRFTPRFT